jgi:superfamily I DNA and/or RNA helicase
MSQQLNFGANKINCNFKALFIDEATQASEIGILKALRYDMEKMVLIGDQ